jgi:hypothetical protein
VLVGFERYMSFRGIGGNHCQLNVIAVPRSADTRAQREFQESAEREGFSLEEVPGPQKVCMATCICALTDSIPRPVDKAVHMHTFKCPVRYMRMI